MHLQSSIQSLDILTQAYTSFDISDKSSTSIDSLQLELKCPKVKLRVYRNISFHNYEPILLMKECEEFINQINFPSFTSLFLNAQNQNIKIKQDRLNQNPRAAQISIKNNDCHFQAKIVPYYNILKKPAFDIVIEPKKIPRLRNEILKLTFLNLKDKVMNNLSLKSQDILKFGRELYRINIVDDTICPNFNWLKEIRVQTQKISGMCRICLSNQSEINNQIISPCACSGSCGYVHIQCLRQWLNIRMIIYKGEKVIAYNFQIFECQICKTDLPKYMKVNDQLVEILPMKLESQSFVMLQKISDTKQFSYVIPFRQGRSVRIKIGRGQDNDIIMNDMSVSRKHAFLNIYPGGDVQLSDNKSTFGTFIALKRNIFNCQRISLMNKRSILKLGLYT